MKKVRLLYCLGVISVFILASCATTKMTYDWKDDTYAGGHISSVMIVGVSNDKNKRNMFEKVFAKQFRLNGVLWKRFSVLRGNIYQLSCRKNGTLFEFHLLNY